MCVVILFSFGILRRVSLCSFEACPGAHSVDQTGLELTEILLPLPPKCWIKGVRHHHPAFAVSIVSFQDTAEGQIFILIMSVLLVFIHEIFYQIIVNTVAFCFNVLTGKIEGIPRMMPKLLNVGGEGGF